MKHRRYVLVVLALSLAALGMPASGALAETFVFRFKGNMATSTFSSFEGGCVYNSVDIFIREGKAGSETGSLTPISEAFVFISQNDTCNGTTLNASGTASLPDQSFDADQQLTSARLDITIDVCNEETNSCFPVSIDLTWKGIGQITRRNITGHSKSPTCEAQIHQNDTRRRAAATGSISSALVSFDAAASASSQLMVAHDSKIIRNGEQCDSDGGAGGFPI
jgi:hypothetical protein